MWLGCWVVFSIWTIRRAVRQEIALRTLSAHWLLWNTQEEDTHPSASWLPLLAALMCIFLEPEESYSISVGGFVVVSEPGADGYIR